MKQEVHKKNLKESVAKDFMECAEAYTEVEFNTLFAQFKRRYPTAVTYLTKSVTPDKWARCYFPGDRYNIVTTNSVESVNSVFIEARKYTLLPMMDMIITKIQEWSNKYRKEANDIPRAQKLVPSVNKMIELSTPIAKLLQCWETNSLTHEYDVLGNDGKIYSVHLSNLSCTCGYFGIDRYPCVHAIQAIIQFSGGT